MNSVIRPTNEQRMTTTLPQSAQCQRQIWANAKSASENSPTEILPSQNLAAAQEAIPQLPGIAQPQPQQREPDFLDFLAARLTGTDLGPAAAKFEAMFGPVGRVFTASLVSPAAHSPTTHSLSNSALQNPAEMPPPTALGTAHGTERAGRMNSQTSGRSPASIAPTSLKMKTKAKSILVIDDEKDILDFVDELLSFRFKVLKAQDAATGLELAQTESPDLIILDLGLQNQSGHDICRVLRERPETKQIPVLIYTGADDIDNLTHAFEQGADDYIVKTSRPRELVARVLAKIRRVEEQSEVPEVLKVGNLELDARRLEVTLDGRSLPLSVLEFNLLRFFVLNLDRVMTRTEILEGVWKGAVVSNRTIDTHMVYLRKKLKGFNHTLATVYGAGYILRAPSRR